MYSLKGFVGIDALASASPDTIPAFGELSIKSMTYATGIGEYNSPTYAGYTLFAFSSASANGVTPVPAALVTQVLNFVNWAYQFQQTGQAAITSTAFTAAMTAQFSQVANSIGCGNMINNGTFMMPEFITWVNPTVTSNDPSAGGQVKIWLCDASFQNQYDGYEIIVVPPIPSIDTFLTSATSAKAALLARTYPSTVNAIQTAKNNYPETILISQTFDFVNTQNASDRTATNWTLLIYGQAGNNLDNIKAAIQSYILSHSQSPLNSWKAVFPDLYAATEFYILPRWANVAIRAMSLQAGAYSAVVNPAKEVAYMSAFLNTAPANYVQNNLAVVPSNYKSLELLMIGDPGNPSIEQNIWTLFQDIINVPTTDVMFNMMSVSTRAWITMIEQMLVIAETATLESSLPAGMSRAVRNNVLFIAQEFSGVNYLVATKNTTPGY